MSSTYIDHLWDDTYKSHRAVFESTFAKLKPAVAQWVEMAGSSIEQGGKILFCGNGGSAADAQHLAAELAVRLSQTRRAIPALCLNLDPSAMTATGNDFGFEYVFARQIEALGKPQDILVGISTSGKSPNVLRALEAARAVGIKTVGLGAGFGGIMADYCDLMIGVPDTTETARIQEMHITLGHVFCFALEKRLNLT